MSSREHGSVIIQRPGLTKGSYPERLVHSLPWYQTSLRWLAGLGQNSFLSSWRHKKTVKKIHALQGAYRGFDDTRLNNSVANLRLELNRCGLTPALAIKAFAIIREVADRALGMSHYQCQLLGGLIMLHGGLAEMETGEGKTLTATLTAATVALTGIPVHVVTVNDYLVRRDAEYTEPLYKRLGLTVGAATQTMPPSERRKAYSCDITYCNNKQLVFDYLRDRILLGADQGRRKLELEKLHSKSNRTEQLFLRGLSFAIVDEADSVLIDEAKTPLIISRSKNGSEEEKIYREAVGLARQLLQEKDYFVDLSQFQISLTDKGQERLGEISKELGGIWSGIRRREELVTQALAAIKLYQRDHHYLVHDGKVMIIDKNTGRTMADRSWGYGLHQMIEVKERCQVTGQKDHLARMTYQRFFARYLNLAGMTGTASEVKKELLLVYDLSVIKVPTRLPTRREMTGKRVFADMATKWQIVLHRVEQLQKEGRPVLIGTTSVKDSELLGRLLSNKAIEHQILNAHQDEKEAEIIAKAGHKKSVTVATNMAGRGTDIALASGVAELGGLHVIASECNEAHRVDRQLFGRCGRQGDPGSYELLLSLEDSLLHGKINQTLYRLLGSMIKNNMPCNQLLSNGFIRYYQKQKEQQHLNERRDLRQLDEQLNRLLAFSGRRE